MGWGLRGATEHSALEVKHIAHGILEQGHEYAGYKWYGYDGLIDKSHQLSTNNGHVRDHKVSDLSLYIIFL